MEACKMNNNFWTSELERIKEARIRQFSEQIGKQVGQVVTDLVSEFMTLVIEGKSVAATTTQPVASFPGKGLLSAREVADILNISKAKAYQMMNRGEIPTIRMGRTARVRSQDLEEFIEAHLYED
jgi:excisionase family DNA binding protein